MRQVRRIQPIGGIQVTHQIRHSIVGLGRPDNSNILARHFDAIEIHTIRQGPHQLVEYTANDRPVALQVLNDLHPLEQLLAAGFQFADFLDPRIQYGNFFTHELVTRVLLLDCPIQILVPEEHRTGRDHQDTGERHQKALLALLA
ncbi:hypothetical protein D3C71_1425180 [compost metagenome]